MTQERAGQALKVESKVQESVLNQKKSSTFSRVWTSEEPNLSLCECFPVYVTVA